jgi:RNAse (barnase) inhibitor barstar
VSAPRPGVRSVRRAAAAVAADAERQGAAVAVIGPVDSKAELLAAFAGALAFPDWVGRNWDALADALRDLSWLPAGPRVVVWAGAGELRAAQPAAYRTALEVLREASAPSVDSAHPLTVLLATR